MPYPWGRALRYRDRAAECKAMADIAQNREFRERYRAIAQYYMTLAEAEETLAKKSKNSEQVGAIDASS